MSKERRHQDDEIRQILELAIDRKGGPAQSLPAVDGLTLLELQDVGREVGLPPDRITSSVARKQETRMEHISRRVERASGKGEWKGE